MSEPRIGPERLAALLDGRLDDVERARLLTELARSDADRAVLGEAAAVLRELELAGEIAPDALAARAGDSPPPTPRFPRELARARLPAESAGDGEGSDAAPPSHDRRCPRTRHR